MKLIKILFILFVAGLSMVATNNLSAQCGTCCQLQCNNTLRSSVVTMLNAQYTGLEFRVSKRKQLRIDGIESFSLNGCDVVIRLRITLRRRFLKDRSGIAIVRTRISSVDLSDPANRIVCLENINVSKIRLSVIGLVREKIYAKIANDRLPDNLCGRF